ncbi:MAG: hypothetical protein ACRC3J_01860 [Culicoidibacterales bacterium]
MNISNSQRVGARPTLDLDSIKSVCYYIVFLENNMKRENFEIRFEGQVVIKHTWNAAQREVEKLIRNIALEEGQAYSLTSKTSELHPTMYKKHHKGTRVWTGDNGKQVSFEIELL